jgi:hypothetical protein
MDIAGNDFLVTDFNVTDDVIFLIVSGRYLSSIYWKAMAKAILNTTINVTGLNDKLSSLYSHPNKITNAAIRIPGSIFMYQISP